MPFLNFCCSFGKGEKNAKVKLSPTIKLNFSQRKKKTFEGFLVGEDKTSVGIG